MTDARVWCVATGPVTEKDVGTFVEHSNKANDLLVQRQASTVNEGLADVSSSNAEAETSESPEYKEMRSTITSLHQFVELGNKRLENMEDMLALAFLKNMLVNPSDNNSGNGRQGKGRAKWKGGKGKGKQKATGFMGSDDEAGNSWRQEFNKTMAETNSKDEMDLDTDEASSGQKADGKKKDGAVSRLPPEALRRIMEVAGQACIESVGPLPSLSKKKRKKKAEDNFKSGKSNLPMTLEQSQSMCHSPLCQVIG